MGFLEGLYSDMIHAGLIATLPSSFPPYIYISDEEVNEERKRRVRIPKRRDRLLIDMDIDFDIDRKRFLL